MGGTFARRWLMKRKRGGKICREGQFCHGGRTGRAAMPGYFMRDNNRLTEKP
jgi:hypothetical protein